MDTITKLKTDRQGYDNEYRGSESQCASASNKEKYIRTYSRLKLTPFYLGDIEHGYRLGTATKMLIKAADTLGRTRGEITVLDAGCGRGELSVYLACLLACLLA